MDIEKELYKIGKWALVIVIGGGLAFLVYGEEIWARMPECVFRKVTGLYCPGCGMTRALYYFFRGHFFKSFMYHPVVPYGIIYYLYFMIYNFVNLHLFNGRLRSTHGERGIYIGIAIGIVQWIVKNVLLLI